ncbi:hypothetical protein PDN64_24590 [Bacillus cereus group sp. Bc256]|uniref:hypothetical protein n=1 Tax=unclassified Bacillus cereus group TaxID=2750818 RepID=UPI001F57116E|nr:MULTISPECIES: hypothetical protein [unclassified Bacillus cereus group]MDA2141264.1 hypothetical protein [Bacillus cereus group sp. Bc256]MDA2599133.1 hypothetical protein [Bacillus cereus group sp. Bc061]
MSFLKELISFFNGFDLGPKIALTALATMCSTTVVNLIQIKLKNHKIDPEMLSIYNQILDQRNVKKEKSKNSKGLSNFIATMFAIIFISELSKSMKKTQKRKNRNKLIISALFLESKMKKIHKAYFTIGFGSILLLALSFYFSIPLYINIIPFLFAILTCSYQFLLNYRIKSGLFGTNDYEARELIEFIIRNNDKINGNKIFNEEAISNTIVDFSNYVKKVQLLNEH